MPCRSCGGSVEAVLRGRPREFCLTCRPRKRELAVDESGSAVCVMCGNRFHTRMPSVAKYCSTVCKETARKVPCTSCGEPMWFGTTLSATPTCLPCRRARPTYRGRRRRGKRESGVIETWECAGCGVECTRPATKGQRPKWCAECRLLSRDWVPVRVRREVYVRDGWACWLCEEPVDRELIGTHSEWRPSLDHVVPRSKGGTDDPENLRLAHLWCNVVRNDERAYSPEDFRVSA